MPTTPSYPKIVSAEPLAEKRLSVLFDNGEKRVYDCTPLLEEEAFAPLREEPLFRAVKADRHGHGVIWNDRIDLAESELWLHGVPVE